MFLTSLRTSRQETDPYFDGNVVESSGNPDDLENIRAYAVAYLREEQHKDLTALGVAFDNYYLESSLYSDGRVAKAVQAIRNAGKTYEKDGALWFKSTDYGDDKDRVMRKADGSYTYFVPDVAYHLAKFERGFNRALNIQGSDHHGTVARVRAGIQAASGDFGFNIPKTFPEYMLHKMLQVVKDGQPVKMSKRSALTSRSLTWSTGSEKMLHVSSWLIAEPTLSLFLMWIWPLAVRRKPGLLSAVRPCQNLLCFCPGAGKRH